MILDKVIGWALDLFDYVLGLLPSGHLSLPGATGLADVLGGLDSLVPILLPVQLALVILAALAVFLVVRAVLALINIVVP